MVELPSNGQHWSTAESRTGDCGVWRRNPAGDVSIMPSGTSLRGHVPISSGFWRVGVRAGAVRCGPSGSGHRKGTMRLYFPAGPGRFEQLQLSHEPLLISVLAVRSYYQRLARLSK